MTQPWQRFVLSKFSEYDDYLWIFGGKGVSPNGYLKEYGDFFYSNLLTDKNKILQSQRTYGLGGGLHSPRGSG